MSRIKNYPTPDLPTLENIFEYQKFEYPLVLFLKITCMKTCMCSQQNHANGVVLLHFHSIWKPEGALVQKIHMICNTQAKELIRSRNSIIMDKRIQLSL